MFIHQINCKSSWWYDYILIIHNIFYAYNNLEALSFSTKRCKIGEVAEPSRPFCVISQSMQRWIQRIACVPALLVSQAPPLFFIWTEIVIVISCFYVDCLRLQTEYVQCVFDVSGLYKHPIFPQMKKIISANEFVGCVNCSQFSDILVGENPRYIFIGLRPSLDFITNRPIYQHNKLLNGVSVVREKGWNGQIQSQARPWSYENDSHISLGRDIVELCEKCLLHILAQRNLRMIYLPFLLYIVNLT